MQKALGLIPSTVENNNKKVRTKVIKRKVNPWFSRSRGLEILGICLTAIKRPDK
jgi:hypothetical protein